MSEYPLRDVAEFTEQDGEQYGLLITCPCCGAIGSVVFSGTRYAKEFGHSGWERTGIGLDSLSLRPSVAMLGHFHSWIRDGKLLVDSPFSCNPREKALVA